MTTRRKAWNVRTTSHHHPCGRRTHRPGRGLLVQEVDIDGEYVKHACCYDQCDNSSYVGDSGNGRVLDSRYGDRRRPRRHQGRRRRQPVDHSPARGRRSPVRTHLQRLRPRNRQDRPQDGHHRLGPVGERGEPVPHRLDQVADRRGQEAWHSPAHDERPVQRPAGEQRHQGHDRQGREGDHLLPDQLHRPRRRDRLRQEQARRDDPGRPQHHRRRGLQVGRARSSAPTSWSRASGRPTR